MTVQQKVLNMDFGEALRELLNGSKVARTGWNGRGMWVHLQVPDRYSKMRRPYLYMYPADGDFVPWTASQSDILATDWMIVMCDDEV